MSELDDTVETVREELAKLASEMRELAAEYTKISEGAFEFGFRQTAYKQAGKVHAYRHSAAMLECFLFKWEKSGL